MSINISNNHKKNVSEYSDLSVDAEIKSMALQEQLNKIHVEHHELSQANHAKYLQLLAIHSSISWRLTAPFRYMVKRFERVNNAVSLLFTVFNNGGIVGTAKKLSEYYLQDGLSGLMLGLRKIALNTNTIPISGNYPSGNNNYTEWVSQFDTLCDADRANMRATQTDFNLKPLISVIMPTYNPRAEWLIEAIESVRSQIYENWELCIADDASTNPAIRVILERYASQDSRIKVLMRAQNGHISEASNSAVAISTGSWIALLDHDDLLPEHALFWVAHSINTQPEVRLIYSDEDKTDAVGRRFDPYFKCDWNPDLFYSHNMFSHLGVYEASLLREVGGFRKGFEGSQDYDLALRCIEQIKQSQIFHIPRVLYQWRVHADSTALTADTKPYAMIAGECAISEHFKRTGIKGAARSIGYGYSANFDLPKLLPLVSIIIPTRDGLNLLKQCIDSILTKTTYENYEILIVDNGSEDQATLIYLKHLETQSAQSNSTKNIRVLRDDSSFNFSRLNNIAVNQSNGEIVALLNNDIEVITPEWLSIMVSHALRENIGAVGAKLYYQNDTIQHAGITLGVGGVAANSHRLRAKSDYGYMGRAVLTQNYSAVSAACLVIKKFIYQQVGGLNEVELSVGYNDVDFCLRVREAGFRNLWTSNAELYHHESATRGSDETHVNKKRLNTEAAYMKLRWGDLLQNDPAYSPNLTLESDDFSYAWPPRVPTLPLHSNLAAYMLSPKPVDRIGKTLFSIKKDGLGLQIGCIFNTIATKEDGYNFHVVERATADELRMRYSDNPTALNNIHKIDFVWRNELLSNLIARTHCYDWIIASHIIENVNDVIGFLRQCEELLAPDGIISFVISDTSKRFEYYRNLTNTDDLLEKFIEDRNNKLRDKISIDSENVSNKVLDIINWGNVLGNDVIKPRTLDETENTWKLKLKNLSQFDNHSWQFTPSSFRIILNDLQTLGLTELAEAGSFDTMNSEFWITLQKRVPSSVIYDRISLSRKLLSEIHHQQSNG